jgi:thymidine kinase
MGLHIIMGNMFSGKTSEMIRRLKRYKVIGKKIVVINSQKDTRSSEEVLRTHDNVTFRCIKTNDLSTMDIDDCDVVAVDEAQFFLGLKPFVEKAMVTGKTVLLAGLDGDYKQRKFGELVDCIPLADEVTKLSAMCMDCMDGTQGPFTKRIVKSKKLELVGGDDMYKAVCRKHLYSSIN